MLNGHAFSVALHSRPSPRSTLSQLQPPPPSTSIAMARGRSSGGRSRSDASLATPTHSRSWPTMEIACRSVLTIDVCMLLLFDVRVRRNASRCVQLPRSFSLVQLADVDRHPQQPDVGQQAAGAPAGCRFVGACSPCAPCGSPAARAHAAAAERRRRHAQRSGRNGHERNGFRNRSVNKHAAVASQRRACDVHVRPCMTQVLPSSSASWTPSNRA